MHLKPRSLHMMQKGRKSLVQLARSASPDYTILMGDQLDSHEIVKVSCLHALTSLVEELTQVSPVVMLVGNHDMMNNRQYCNEEHAFSSMRHMPNLTIVDRPTVVNAQQLQGSSQPSSGEVAPSLICCPFLPKGRFQEALDEYLPTRFSDWRERRDDCIVFAHQEFRGVAMNQVVSETGDCYDSTWPMVVSGHIHERQTVGGNIYYVGSPWATSFTSPEGKTVSILNFHVPIGLHFDVDEHRLSGVPRTVQVKIENLIELETFRLEPYVMYKVTVVGTPHFLHRARMIIRMKWNPLPEWDHVLVIYRTVGDVSSEGRHRALTDKLSIHSIRKDFCGRTMRKLNELIDQHKDRDSLVRSLEEYCCSPSD